MDSIEFEDDIVSVEETIEVDSEDKLESPLTKAARAVFYVTCLLFPVWFLPATIDPVDLNKASFISIATLVMLLFALGGLLQEGRIRTVRSRIFSMMFFVLAVWFLSSLFSQSLAQSFWGFGGESTSFVHMLVLGVLFFLVPLLVRNESQIRRALGFISTSLLLAFIFFFVQSVVGKDLFNWEFAKIRSFHPFGSWNALAIFFGFGAALTLPFFGAREKMKWFYCAIFCFLLVGILFTNFSVIWGILATVALLFVALTLSRREQNSALFAVSLVTLLVSILFVLLNVPLATYFQAFEGFGRLQEIVPSYSNTLEGVKRALSDSPLLGEGPNTYGLLWEQMKPESINSTIFWQTRFASGFNTIFTLAAEVGVVGLLAIVVLIGLFVWHGTRAIGFMGDIESTSVRATFAGALFLAVALFFYPFSFALWTIFFITVGLLFAALGEHGALPVRETSFFETRERGFLFSLLLIFLLVGGVIWTYFETTRYLALVAYSRGIDTFNTDESVNGSLEHIRRAITLDPYQDRYYRTYAQLENIKMSRAISQGTDISQEERVERFRAAYTEAKARAEAAIALGKKDSQNYRVLGQIYELAIPFDETVANLAIKNYETARELAPVDPLLLMDLARTYLALSDITILRGGGTASRKVAAEKQDKAIDYLLRVTELKPDLAQARFTLSQLYFARNQIDQAIGQAEATVLLTPDNIGSLFQLGFLYYQRGSFERARPVFERAVVISPNYSNARYFLGLIYDRDGRANDSLTQFEEILRLNPDNAEVARIVDALKAGKKATSVLDQPPPEKRKDAPLGEGGQNIIPAL